MMDGALKESAVVAVKTERQRERERERRYKRALLDSPTQGMSASPPAVAQSGGVWGEGVRAE